MKINKNVVAFIAALGLAGFFGARLAAYQFGSGSMNLDEERNQLLLAVYNADDVAHEAGDVVVWHTGSQANGLYVTTTTSYANHLVAGVVPYGYTLPAQSWGFIQRGGYHPALTIASTTAAGSLLVTSVTGEAAATWQVHGSSVTTAKDVSTSSDTLTGLSVFAIAIDGVAAASSSTVKAMLLLR